MTLHLRLITLLLVLPGLVTVARAADEASRPNIVVIMSDDMGYSDAGCMGGEIDTPNLDRLAAGGIRFTQFYNTSRCCPTRASLLTGLYPHQADMGHMTGSRMDIPGYRNNLSHDAVTLAEVLGEAGYSTYMTGKWHVAGRDKKPRAENNWPMQRGFDRFYGTITGGGNYFDPATLTRGNTPITPESDPEYTPSRGPFYYTDAIADESARFVREHHARHAERPFFLYVAFTAPHWPLHAMPEEMAKYKGRYDAGYETIRSARFEKMKSLGLVDPSWELSPAPQTWDEVKPEHQDFERRCMEVYAAQVDRMDQGIGKVLAALESAADLDNTLVLYLQDNGACAEDMGRNGDGGRARAKRIKAMKPTEVQKEVFPLHTRDGQPIRDGKGVLPGPEETYVAYGESWANVSNTPFRQYKHYVHEGGIATPLIAHWPAGISRKGELDRQPGHLIDIMPTCVAISGAKYPSKTNEGSDILPMQGVSLVPAFAGGPLDRRQPIFFEHEGNRAIRDGKWKLVAKGIDGPWELYDLEADRTEMNNLAGQEPARAKAMAEQWQAWAEASNVLPMRPWDKKGAREPTGE